MTTTYATVSCSCLLCGKETAVTVPVRGFLLWQAGVLIQDALPELTAGERETLITGLCEPCQDSLAGDDDE